MIIVLSLLFMSCRFDFGKTNKNNAYKNEQKQIQKSLWDCDNIALQNTTSFNTETVVYPRTEGASGIIGTFHLESEQFGYMTSYTQKEHFEFYDNGYYYKYYVESSLKKNEEYGIYRITKINNDYFQVDLYSLDTNSNNQNIPRASHFYQVSNTAIVFLGFYNENEQTIRPTDAVPFQFF